jgi:hypothetical protein
MLGVFVLSLTLLGLSGALIDSHRRSWRDALEKADLPERVRRFVLAQYRRRLQASGMIGVIGALVAVWPLVPRLPGPMMFYVAVLLAGCGWIMLLAVLDLFATRHHFRRLRDEQMTAHLQIILEMKGQGKMTNDE